MDCRPVVLGLGDTPRGKMKEEERKAVEVERSVRFGNGGKSREKERGLSSYELTKEGSFSNAETWR